MPEGGFFWRPGVSLSGETSTVTLRQQSPAGQGLLNLKQVQVLQCAIKIFSALVRVCSRRPPFLLVLLLALRRSQAGQPLLPDHALPPLTLSCPPSSSLFPTFTVLHRPSQMSSSPSSHLPASQSLNGTFASLPPSPIASCLFLFHISPRSARSSGAALPLLLVWGDLSCHRDVTFLCGGSTSSTVAGAYSRGLWMFAQDLMGKDTAIARCQHGAMKRKEEMWPWGRLSSLKESLGKLPIFTRLITSPHGLGSRSPALEHCLLVKGARFNFPF